MTARVPSDAQQICTPRKIGGCVAAVIGVAMVAFASLMIAGYLGYSPDLGFTAAAIVAGSIVPFCVASYFLTGKN